ncbi:unnamed protein product [marine sediment metagenome]|uniref:Uncharacterized protein n=1 Tax=marine sediment metagenome TaxID=412755 RepID=X1Q2P4_9ZZZZ
MSHKYDNFDDAYYYLAERYEYAKENNDWANTNQRDAYDGASDPVDKLHFGYLCGAVYNLYVCLNELADFAEATYDQSHLYESIYWGAKGNGANGVTMSAILSAMIAADFDDFQAFVGIVDGYRAALWNKPFNAEYYAALARGFMT